MKNCDNTILLFNKRLLIILGLLFLYHNNTYAQDIGSPRIVDRIEVIGNNYVSSSTLLKLLPFAVGKEFDVKSVADSISILNEYEFFETIKVSYQLNEQGNAVVLFQVTEKPWISSITIKGNDDVSTTTIKNKLSNSVNKFYNSFNNEKDIKTLLNIYLATGFIGTKIDIEAKVLDKTKNNIDLMINIYEGEKLFIKKVNILGNEILPSNYLKDSLDGIKEPSVLGLIKHSFIPELLANEEKKMVLIAKQKGFLDFEIIKKEIILSLSSNSVTDNLYRLLRTYGQNKLKFQSYQKRIHNMIINPNAQDFPQMIEELRADLKQNPRYEKELETINLALKSLEIQAETLINAQAILRKSIPESVPLIVKVNNEKNSHYTINFTVKEGSQYLFSFIDILGSQFIVPEFLKQSFLNMDPGDIYNVQSINQFKALVEQYYRDRGYFGIIIQDTPLKNDKLLTIGHRIIVQEGEKMHIEKMYIKNNHKTKSYVIDRELRIKEGSIFNQSDILLSQRLLQRTGYFQNINIIPSPGSEENLLDLTWLVEEQKTGSFRFGGGYGTETGFSVYGTISETNFLGEGINTSLNAQWGQYQRSLQVAVSSQYIGYVPVGWSLSTGYTWYRENASPRYDRDGDGTWDKIILKDGVYYFIQKGDPDFYQYYDENRTGSFVPPSGTGTGSAIDFEPGVHDDIYSESRYFDRQMIYLELGAGYSFADFWSVQLSNGISFSRYNNAHNIDIDKIYVDDYYTLKKDLLSGRFIYSSYLRLGLNYNSTNSPMTPTTGIRTGINADLYGVEGGSNQFIRLAYTFNAYLSLISLKKHDFELVWANGLNLASNVPFFNGEFKIHYENLLSFNTMEEIRGWSQYLGNSEFVGLGKVSFGTELRASIPYTNKVLWLVAFFDGGHISDEPSTLPGDFQNYFYSTGVGVRIDFSSFPLRFYLAQRLLWDKDKHFFKAIGGLTFEFAITSSF